MESPSRFERYVERWRTNAIVDSVAVVIVIVILSLAVMSFAGTDVVVPPDKESETLRATSKRQVKQVEQVEQDVRDLNRNIKRDIVLERVQEWRSKP